MFVRQFLQEIERALRNEAILVSCERGKFDHERGCFRSIPERDLNQQCCADRHHLAADGSHTRARSPCYRTPGCINPASGESSATMLSRRRNSNVADTAGSRVPSKVFAEKLLCQALALFRECDRLGL